MQRTSCAYKCVYAAAVCARKISSLSRHYYTSEDVVRTENLAVLIRGSLVASGAATAQSADTDLEHVVAEMADTPTEHRVLAQHYTALAERARADERRHERVARVYVVTRNPVASAVTIASRMRKRSARSPWSTASVRKSTLRKPGARSNARVGGRCGDRPVFISSAPSTLMRLPFDGREGDRG